MKTAAALFLLIPVILVSCQAADKGEAVPLYPAEPPEFVMPVECHLDDFTDRLAGQKVNIDRDTSGKLFENCEVWITARDICITDSAFINCRVYVCDSADILFERVVFRDQDIYERAALSINDSNNVSIVGSQFTGNYIGLGIHGSSAQVSGCRFENNNGHNALVIGEGSSVNVSGNYFFGSFPHALLVMNREGSAQASVTISGNLIDQAGEDAIDFEDFRDAAPSCVTGNIITSTGWSAVLVEYNSWNANIVISGNWIENTGIDWRGEVHPNQGDKFQNGWGHGIMVEDASAVLIERNRIISAGENGIMVRNGRDIRLEANGIGCSGTGIAVYNHLPSALSRPFSPLLPERAGNSHVTAEGNVIMQAERDYYTEPSSTLITGD